MIKSGATLVVVHIPSPGGKVLVRCVLVGATTGRPLPQNENAKADEQCSPLHSLRPTADNEHFCRAGVYSRRSVGVALAVARNPSPGERVARRKP